MREKLWTARSARETRLTKHDWFSSCIWLIDFNSDWLTILHYNIPCHKNHHYGIYHSVPLITSAFKICYGGYPPSTTSKSIFHFYLNNSHQPLTVRAHSGRLKQFFSITCVVIVKLAQTMDCCHKPVNVNHSNWYWQQYMILTLYTLTSVSIFSTLFTIHSPWYWLGEFV